MQELMTLYQGQSLNAIAPKFPEPLSKEEEFEIFTKYQEFNNTECYKEIVFRNLRFVAHVVRGYKSALDDMELFQEGVIGLMKCIKKYDLSYGVRFASYATRYIKSEINDFVFKNISVVRSIISKSSRKLFFNQSVIEENGITEKGIKVTANTLNVSTTDVRDFIQRKNGFVKESLEYETEVVGGVGFSKIDDIDYNFVDDLIDEEESVNRTQELNDALNNLSCREKDIVVSSYFKDVPLRVLADKWDVSTARIGQLKIKALKHLKESMS